MAEDTSMHSPSRKTGATVAMASALVVLALAASCGSDDPQPSGAGREPSVATPTTVASPTARPLPSPTPGPSSPAPSSGPPEVDTAISSVPIEEVLFDTFGSGYIPLSVAPKDVIDALRDAIKPIYEPKYDVAEKGDWMRDDDMVIGYVSESGAAFAYPIKMLNLHEIVNDNIDGIPVLVSYCPLCASAVVYHREVNGTTLLFGNTSALYDSDMVMFDHQTGSYWHQVIGRAIVGTMTGSELRPLPSRTIAWAEWKLLHPETRILSRDLGLLPTARGNPYDRDPYVGYADRLNDGSSRPVAAEKLDGRLRPGDMVTAVQIGESHRAYPLVGTDDRVINDVVDGTPVLINIRGEQTTAPAGSAYLRELDGQELIFSLVEGVMVDDATGSRWDDGGRAISGTLAGSRLAEVPTRTSFWFAVVAAVPGIELYGGPDGP